MLLRSFSNAKTGGVSPAMVAIPHHCPARFDHMPFYHVRVQLLNCITVGLHSSFVKVTLPRINQW